MLVSLVDANALVCGVRRTDLAVHKMGTEQEFARPRPNSLRPQELLDFAYAPSVSLWSVCPSVCTRLSANLYALVGGINCRGSLNVMQPMDFDERDVSVCRNVSDR